jgi:hypothetical protein
MPDVLPPPIPDPVFEVDELTTPTYRATVVDDSDPPVALPAASLTTLTLSLYVINDDGTITYIRQAQNVKNTNNVTVSALGALVWSIQAADTTLVNTVPYEHHYAFFRWTWGSGKVGSRTIVLNVRQLPVVA